MLSQSISRSIDALLLKSGCTVSGAAVALVVSAGERNVDHLEGGGGDGQVRYRGLVRRRSGSLATEGLVQQLPGATDNDADDEHFV